MHTQLLGEPGTGGSSTPSMVGAVKKWQKSDPQNSLETWRKLSDANSALELHFNTLSRLADEDSGVYGTVINNCSMLTYDKVSSQNHFNYIILQMPMNDLRNRTYNYLMNQNSLSR